MIFENSTAWDTDDLRALVQLALTKQRAATASEPVRVRDDTLFVVTGRKRGQPVGEVGLWFSDSGLIDAAVFFLLPPHKVGISAVDALASVPQGGCGLMPTAMLEELWDASCAAALGVRYWRSVAKELVKQPGGLHVLAHQKPASSCPTRWLQFQISEHRRDLARTEQRWIAARDRLTRKIDKCQAELGKDAQKQRRRGRPKDVPVAG